MPFIFLHDKNEIETFFKKNIYLHLYSIGDLDEFFWPYTAWYGLKAGNTLSAIALLYAAPSLPVLLAVSEKPALIQELLTQILYLLPPRFYAHLTPGLETVFIQTHNLEPHGEHYKMLKTVDHIGLNVKADNAAAIACYCKLGFEVIGSYNEFMLDKKV